jgi:hypothetical protein
LNAADWAEARLTRKMAGNAIRAEPPLSRLRRLTCFETPISSSSVTVLDNRFLFWFHTRLRTEYSDAIEQYDLF